MTFLQCQLSLLPEGRDQGTTALHRTQPSPCKVTDLVQTTGAEIADFMSLQVTPQVFNRIEFRRIGWQESQLDINVLALDILAHEFTSVCFQSVPDDEQRSGYLSIQRFQKFDDLWPLDAAGKQAEVELPESYAGNRRELMPGKTVLQNRRFTAGRPGSYLGGTFREARFVDENYGLAAFFSVFFSAGHCVRFQVRIACSSRWMARPVGRWHENPSDRNRRHTCTSLYAWPKRSMISARTRGKVHSSVGKPAATAPRLSKRVNSRRSALPKLLGRPSGLALSASRPSASSFFAQVLTDWRLTPSLRATSACGTLFSNSRAACSRRRWSAFRSRFISRPRCHCYTTSLTTGMKESVSHLCKPQ